jgi:hypothetical protein
VEAAVDILVALLVAVDQAAVEMVVILAMQILELQTRAAEAVVELMLLAQQ